MSMVNYSLIKNNIDKFGYAEEKSFFSEKDLKFLRDFVDKKLKENNYQYFFLTSEASETSHSNLLNNKVFFKKIENILKNVIKAYKLPIRSNERLYKVLRVVTGKKSNKVSLDYHFDAHALTLLIPIYIPNRPKSDNGNLLIYKNLRELHKNLILNILQKIFYQNYFFSKLLNFNFWKKFFGEQTLKLIPKNIYIFNGFRTLHTNLPVHPEDIRATILVHYHDIFYESKLIKLNRRFRIIKELRNIKKNKISS